MSDTATTIATRAPRLIRNPRRRDAGELLEPIAPSVLARVGESEAAIEHQRAVAHYGELRQRLPLVDQALREARMEAEHAARAAIRGGKPAPSKPAARVSELEQQLLDLGEALDVAEGALEETALALLSASVPALVESKVAAEKLRETARDQAAKALAQALRHLEQSAASTAELVWLGRMIRDGEAPSFGTGSPRPGSEPGYEATVRASGLLEQGRQREAEGLAQIRHDEHAVNVVTVAGDVQRPLPEPPLPDGAEVWVVPGETAEPQPEPAAAAGE